MTKQRCIILIDGSNFYYKLKDLQLHNLLKFDFAGFTKYLAGKYEIVQADCHGGKLFKIKITDQGGSSSVHKIK